MDIGRLAGHLDDARRHGREVERLTLEAPDLDLPQAYRVMDAGIALRVARGERIIGMKMGLTSEAKRRQMSLAAPIYGVLTDAMVVRGTFRLGGTLHPKIEPEIAFRFARGLSGAPDRSAVLAACTSVGPALEILDSRYRDFKYFSLPDVVADNASSSHVVLPEQWVEVEGRDLGRVELVMSVNGTPRQRATGAAISGDPVLSVIQLCELLAGRGQSLAPGSVVLAGAATAAEPLAPGMEVRLEAGWLGSISVRVEP
ncbi:MAG TPA: fumarylacetoacetate hydrolase family protein [Myxococcaceae bacterium]|nr:fumarylacetoacetate hydrolase family protein [Myxococcaceae bacterium]